MEVSNPVVLQFYSFYLVTCPDKWYCVIVEPSSFVFLLLKYSMSEQNRFHSHLC